ncbi:hypothetical protein ISF6_2787 [Piscinibacter sakaiensis]|uniref:Uncharacterized protein n=1 Tax=Piscinibacter sakaiensis TaxID=1547922 RepID=A0A0K8NVI0_PISS1|nr:hypothetical protein ISF6_2787 [Piscinibacter sakaiensis]
MTTRPTLESAPRAGRCPSRPPRGSRKLGAARRFLESAPRAGRCPSRPPRGTRKLGAARRFLVRRAIAPRPVAVRACPSIGG